MVYITGDCHGNFDKFHMKNFPDQKGMTRDDIVIVCGDFGIWHDTAEERYNLDALNRRSFTTVFVDGNHENFDRLYGNEFPVVDFHGGKAHKIRSHIFHLMRGYVFDFDGKKFWCFGGARSHDIRDGILDRNGYESEADFKNALFMYWVTNKSYRVNHISWWREEVPSPEEMDFGAKALDAAENKVDFIVTHTCPFEVATFLGYRDPDPTEDYLNLIAHTVQFDKWYCGHLHMNTTVFGKFNILYEKIERIV